VRTVAVAACVAVAAAMTPATRASAHGPGSRDSTVGGRTSADTGGAFGGSDTVTLITGDRVILDAGRGVTAVLPAAGRERVPIQVLTSQGHTHVFPEDAVPLIADGTLDKRLFDITELSRAEYRDLGGLPVIVRYDAAADASAYAERVSSSPGAVESRRLLESINAEALLVEDGAGPALWKTLTEPADGGRRRTASPGVTSVALDAIMKGTLVDSVPQIRAPQAWEAGYDGTGTTIAILDTGVDDTHPDLAGKVVASRNFSPSPDDRDRNGHGTHVASIAASSGDPYTGVAPGARLLSGKVLDDSGNGLESDVIEGMEWAVTQGADVINMSLGAPDTGTISPVEAALDALSASSDSLFVVAAGNYGPTSGVLGTPGVADAALSVGAVTVRDAVDPNSSVGPRLRDGAIKPDVTAPGIDVAAAGAAGSAVWERGTPVDDTHVSLSGTSMAAPHVAGAAAILAQAHPDWTGEELKAALLTSAVSVPGHTVFQQGFGRVDVASALRQTVIAEPPSLAFGLVTAAQPDPPVVQRAVTYRNKGTEDVTLRLSISGTDPEGNPAPEGMFALDAETVTVPAGGTATVRATADSARAGETRGAYLATVTATGDGQTVRVLGSLLLGEVQYDLTVQAIDHEGNPKVGWAGWVFDQATGQFSQLVSNTPTGTVTVSLPPGDYAIQANHTTYAADGTAVTYAFLQPDVSLTEDTTTVLDARRARPLSLTPPDPGAPVNLVNLFYEMVDDGTGVRLGGQFLLSGTSRALRTAQVGPVPPGWALRSALTVRAVDGDRDYHLGTAREGALLSGIDRRVRAGELALITTRMGASLPDRWGYLATVSPYQSTVLLDNPFPLPATRRVYVQGAAGAWRQVFQEVGDRTVGSFSSPLREYQAGRRYEANLNTAVFGPRTGAGDGVFRQGNTIYGTGLAVTDGGGHQGSLRSQTATTVLYRNGEEYATRNGNLGGARFTVPADEAAYELVSTVTRPAAATALSTRIVSSYAFTSGPVSGEPVLLGNTSVVFTPRLALDGTSPARRTVTVPVTVQGAGLARSLAVWVSTDGGGTWRRVRVTGGVVRVDNPPAGGSVSLRARVADARGGSVTQTIIDAYRTA
jgi:subtilisin family serine protease